MKLPKNLPFGRIADLRALPDAHLIAVKPGRGLFDDYQAKRYNSRLALESFLRNPGDWYALVKTPTEAGMFIYPAFQVKIPTL